MKRYVTKTKLDVNELVLDETTEPWVVLEKDCTFKIRGDVIDKLAEYEDLEEQGRLLKLPCKVGNTVYVISMGKIISLVVEEISTFYVKNEKIINVKCQNADIFRNYIEREFGRVVFLTKEEAEAKLKELWKEYGN